MKLSASQLEVLRRLAASDEPLVYFKGGYWTLPSLVRSTGHFWHVTIGTVRAMESLGLIAAIDSSTNYSLNQYPALADRILTEKGAAEAMLHKFGL